MPFDATPVTSPVIDLLQKAHKLLRKGGWIQYSEKEEGAHCLIGAIREVTPTNKLEQECVKAPTLKRRITSPTGTMLTSVNGRVY